VEEAPASTLDVAATIASVVGAESVSDELVGESLLAEVDADRRVFSQARGEDEDSHLRRYALRTGAERCFGERDTEAEAIEITDSTDTALHPELEAHIEGRVRVENGGGAERSDEEGGDGEVDEEIERRLSALGYTE
jgi:arylsulfatase